MTTEEDMDKNNNENRRFYVYEHIRKDNNTCFYVGKGTGNRAYNLDRGNFHNGVRDKYGCRVKIIKDGLTEEEAFKLETERIEDYVITFGYGIPIDGYKDFSNNKYLTNFTWGGEGVSGLNPYANKTPEEIEIIRRKISEKNKGKNKGKNPYANKTEEEMEIIRRKISEKNKGKNSFENKTEEEMEIIRRKISEKAKGNNPYANKTPEEMEIIGIKISEKVSGEKNGMWGKNPYANKTEEEMEIISKKKSENSGRKQKVICITTGKIFNTINAASHYYNVAHNNISNCCRKVRKNAGKLSDGTPLQWKYLKDYNNEFKGILMNPITDKR